jgi:hypothetical protein
MEILCARADRPIEKKRRCAAFAWLPPGLSGGCKPKDQVMVHRFRAQFAAMPAASPAGITLFLTATLGPIMVFAIVMRIFGG